LAEIADLPGVLAYGQTRNEAIGKAEALALRVLADRIETGENQPLPVHTGCGIDTAQSRLSVC
jgi:predicted RNase H-like HicB family nuclease